MTIGWLWRLTGAGEFGGVGPVSQVTRRGKRPRSIIAVLVAGGNHQHPKADNLGQAMHNLLRQPRVLQAGREAIDYTEPALNLAQSQQTAF